MITEPGSFPNEKNHQMLQIDPNRTEQNIKHQTSSPVSIHHPNTPQKNIHYIKEKRSAKIIEIPPRYLFLFSHLTLGYPKIP